MPTITHALWYLISHLPRLHQLNLLSSDFPLSERPCSLSRKTQPQHPDDIITLRILPEALSPVPAALRLIDMSAFDQNSGAIRALATICGAKLRRAYERVLARCCREV